MCVMMTASIAFSPKCSRMPSSAVSRNFSSSRPQSTTKARPLSARISPKLGQKFGRLNLNRWGETCQTFGTTVGLDTLSW